MLKLSGMTISPPSGSRARVLMAFDLGIVVNLDHNWIHRE